MTLLWAQNPEEVAQLTAWTEERMPEGAQHPLHGLTAAGVVRDETLLAAIVFHDWERERRTMQVSLAADDARWATKRTIKALLAHAFVRCGVNVLWSATAADNTRAAKFAEGIGMKREATLRHRLGPKRHVYILSMTRAEWARSRWALEA